MLLFAVVISLMLGACGTQTSELPEAETLIPETAVPEESELESPLSPVTEPEESPLPSPDAEDLPPVSEGSAGGAPLPTPEAGVVESHAVADELRIQVAAKLDVPLESLDVVSVEAMTWSDASLGCPKPGEMYAQVVIEGWRAVYRDADGNRIDVHAAQDLKQFVICEDGGEEPAKRPAPSEDGPAVEAAETFLARQLDVSADEITVESVEAVEWNDSCLGCGRANESCLMVITPGFRIILSHNGAFYEMHTDATGRSVRLCNEQ